MAITVKVYNNDHIHTVNPFTNRLFCLQTCEIMTLYGVDKTKDIMYRFDMSDVFTLIQKSSVRKTIDLLIIMI